MYIAEVSHLKNVEVGLSHGHAWCSAAQLVGAGHAVVLAAAQHQVAKAVADV